MYYKILYRNEDGILVSPFIKIDKYILQYTPHKRTYPMVGKLFIFSSLDNVDLTVLCNPSLEIWECEVGNPIRWETEVNLDALLKDEGLEEYWNKVDLNTSHILSDIEYSPCLVRPTKETYVCDWVEIQKEY